MAKSWKKRLRRGRLATWLGRIEGVEKPALLVGIGLLLYRVWRNEERRRIGSQDALAWRDRSRAPAVRRSIGQRRTAPARSGRSTTSSVARAAGS